MNGNDNSQPTYPSDPSNPEYRERCILWARLRRALRPLGNGDIELLVDFVDEQAVELMARPPP